MKTSLVLTSLAAAAGLTLAGCSGTSPSASDTASATQSPTPAASAASEAAEPIPEPAAPASAQVGECFYTTTAFQFTDTSDPVACDPGTYTQQTIAVFDLPSDLTLTYPERQDLADAVAGGAELTAEQQADVDAFSGQIATLYEDCRAEVAAAVGQQPNRVSLFSIDVTGPNEEQWDNGERWARCNITRSLPADVKRKENRLLPLPASLSNAANAYANQSCSLGSGKKYRVHVCDGPDFRDGAWLKALTELPLSDVGPYPGTEEDAVKALETECLSAVKYLTQSNAKLKRKNIAVSWRAPAWQGAQRPTATDAWNDPDGTFGCSIPNWAYIQAPTIR